MNTRTASLVVREPKDKVFAYLSQVEHLPEWATDFCRELKVVDGTYKVVSPMGELFFRIQADERSGVIDMFTAPARTNSLLVLLLTRVAGLCHRWGQIRAPFRVQGGPFYAAEYMLGQRL
jgi:uncharacterized protein YndB with AHSA1/START domain